MSIFREKYLKYKNKYLYLKNQLGGEPYCKKIKPNQIDVNYVITAHGLILKRDIINGSTRKPQVKAITYTKKGNVLFIPDIFKISSWLKHRDPAFPCKNFPKSIKLYLDRKDIEINENFNNMILQSDNHNLFSAGIDDATIAPKRRDIHDGFNNIESWPKNYKTTLSDVLDRIDIFHKKTYKSQNTYKVHLLTCLAGRRISFEKVVDLPGFHPFPGEVIKTPYKHQFILTPSMGFIYLLVYYYIPNNLNIDATVWNKLLTDSNNPNKIYNYNHPISLDVEIYTYFGKKKLRDISFKDYVPNIETMKGVIIGSYPNIDKNKCFFYYYDESFNSNGGLP
jgi:hypothetical protein